jgi:hypothetical protein
MWHETQLRVLTGHLAGTSLRAALLGSVADGAAPWHASHFASYAGKS